MAISDTNAPLAAGRVLVERYELTRPVARGGMAEVWEGKDRVLDRAVAIKVLHPHLATDEDFLERFRREAVAAARLNHPNVVSTFDAGMHRANDEVTVPFIVMELVRGPTLREMLKENELPVQSCVKIAMQVADALAHAHSAGLIHRDVKPANILLCKEDGASVGRAMVADFGIARATSNEAADLTQAGALVGTAKYLSPEQIQGKKPDGRSDLYSLGVVLYEMLCGRPPFQGDSDVATALAHLQQTPPLPRTLRAGIPRPLEIIVMRAMARDPGDRFQNAGELRQALGAIDFSDDAKSFIDPNPTPPSGSKPVAAKRSGRSYAPALVILALLCALSVLAAFLIGQIGFGPFARKEKKSDTAPVSVTFAAVRSFDPEGDGKEGESKARLVVDGDTGTTWTSDRYRSRPYGNLKKGVGLIVSTNEMSSFESVTVDTPMSDWSVQLFIGDDEGASLEEWGNPVVSKSGLNGTTTFTLDDAGGRSVLVWITDPGPGARAEVAEITARSRPSS